MPKFSVGIGRCRRRLNSEKSHSMFRLQDVINDSDNAQIQSPGDEHAPQREASVVGPTGQRARRHGRRPPSPGHPAVPSSNRQWDPGSWRRCLGARQETGATKKRRRRIGGVMNMPPGAGAEELCLPRILRPPFHRESFRRYPILGEEK